MKEKFYLLFFIALASCGGGVEKPKNFIEKDKMIDVLYDLALFGGMESTSAFTNDTTKVVINVNSVLNKHGLDSLSFAENNKYYIELTDGTYHFMQKKIEERLELKKAELEKLKEERLEQEKQEKEEKLKKLTLDEAFINGLTLDTIPQLILENLN